MYTFVLWPFWLEYEPKSVTIAFRWARTPAPAPSPVPFAHITLRMAGAFTNVALYDQHDFIPESVLADFATAGYTIQPIFEWFGIEVGLARAMMTEFGCALTDHVSSLAHILPTELELVVTSGSIQGVAVNFVQRAKLRQVLISVRIMVGM